MDKNQTAVDIFNKHAKLYQDKFMDVSLYHSAFLFFCDHLDKKDATVLELACGPGNITRFMLDYRPDFKILGTDLAPNMIELARKNNPEAEFQIMDCRDINKLDQKFDGIMCGFAMPYLTREEAIKLIADASQSIVSGGCLFISTMEDDYGNSRYQKGSTGEEIFMHYHQEDYLSEALVKNEFKICFLHRFLHPDAQPGTPPDLVMIGMKS